MTTLPGRTVDNEISRVYCTYRNNGILSVKCISFLIERCFEFRPACHRCVFLDGNGSEVSHSREIDKKRQARNQKCKIHLNLPAVAAIIGFAWSALADNICADASPFSIGGSTPLPCYIPMRPTRLLSSIDLIGATSCPSSGTRTQRHQFQHYNQPIMQARWPNA